MAKPRAEAGGEGRVRWYEISLSPEDLHFLTAPPTNPPGPWGAMLHVQTVRWALCGVEMLVGRRAEKNAHAVAPIVGEREILFSPSLKS